MHELELKGSCKLTKSGILKANNAERLIIRLEHSATEVDLCQVSGKQFRLERTKESYASEAHAAFPTKTPAH